MTVDPATSRTLRRPGPSRAARRTVTVTGGSDTLRIVLHGEARVKRPRAKESVGTVVAEDFFGRLLDSAE